MLETKGEEVNELKVTGRILPISEATKKRNPSLYGHDSNYYRMLDGKPPIPTKKRIRQDPKPLMNKLEEEFYNFLKPDGEIAEIFIQSMRFKLGNGIWYKPDFVAAMHCGSLKCYEVKGPHAFRGGLENLKVAASRYPQLDWYLVWKQDGEWKEQEVLP